MMALLEVTGMKMVVLLAGGKGAWLLGATGMKTAVLIASRGRRQWWCSTVTKSGGR
jgi:hypothetical protein